MGSPIRDGVGAILIVCANCGRIYLRYTIGDNSADNKAKYGGVPTPKKALSGYDDLVCDNCNRRLHLFPVKIKVMTLRKFNKLFKITADSTGREFLTLREPSSMVKVLIEASHTVGVHGLESQPSLISRVESISDAG